MVAFRHCLVYFQVEHIHVLVLNIHDFNNIQTDVVVAGVNDGGGGIHNICWDPEYLHLHIIMITNILPNSIVGL